MSIGADMGQGSTPGERNARAAFRPYGLMPPIDSAFWRMLRGEKPILVRHYCDRSIAARPTAISVLGFSS